MVRYRAYLRACLRVGEHPGGGGKPQEIDGKDGENPSLCRNRIATAARWELSRNASPGSSPDLWGGDAQPRVPAKV